MILTKEVDKKVLFRLSDTWIIGTATFQLSKLNSNAHAVKFVLIICYVHIIPHVKRDQNKIFTLTQSFSRFFLYDT